MFVFDTSPLINGWRFHYPPKNFPGVWDLLSASIADGRIVIPREVFNELKRQDDDIFQWVRTRAHPFVEPSEAVQAAVGKIYQQFRRRGNRDDADPWVIAEAQVRQFTVVTYEGRTQAGPASPKSPQGKIPGVCDALGIRCVPLSDALDDLGASFA